MNDVGLRIKLRRIELGLTQLELAQRMGYTSKAAICKVEKGQDNLTIDRMLQFAKSLDCDPDWLIGMSQNSHDDFSAKTYSDDYLKSAMMLYNKYIRADSKIRKMIDILLEEGDE